MSRVQIDPRIIQTIQEEDGLSQSLNQRSLAEHEHTHPPLAPPRVQRGRRDTISSSESSAHPPSKPRSVKINKRALDITRRLSMSSAMFSQLLAFQEGGGLGGQSGEVKYGNTYQMEPKEDERFLSREVREIADRALRSKLQDVRYDAKECARLSCSLTNIIKTRLKENLDLPRYKIVVNVIIGQKLQQSVQIASRCIWNEATDSCATSTYENASLFAIATIHGIYVD